MVFGGDVLAWQLRRLLEGGAAGEGGSGAAEGGGLGSGLVITYVLVSVALVRVWRALVCVGGATHAKVLCRSARRETPIVSPVLGFVFPVVPGSSLQLGREKTV
jgi:hypothetical protein